MVDAENIDMEGAMDEDVDQEKAPEEKEDTGLTKEQQEKVKEIFGIFEKEQSGSIEFEALGTVLRWLGYNPTEEELQKYKKEYDKREDDIIKLDNVMKIVAKKSQEPDTIEEFIEAAKIFDHDQDGKIEVTELRWAMTKLGDAMKDNVVDEMIAELDKEKTGFIEIEQFAKTSFNIKEEKEKVEKKGDKKPSKK